MSDGEKLSGQTYEPRTNRTFPFIQQQVDYTENVTEQLFLTGFEGVSGVDINPTDRSAALVRTFDLDAITTMLEAEVYKQPLRGPVRQLPDILKSITADFNKSEGVGASNYPSSQQAFYFSGSGSGSINPRATAQASSSILPVVTWVIETWWKEIEVDQIAYTFNMVTTTPTMADILTKLASAPFANATVLKLPAFKTEQVQLKLFGGQTSLRQIATTSASVSASASAYSGSVEYGDEYSDERGVHTDVQTIPPTIHASITIASATETADVAVSVAANTQALAATGITVAAITNEPTGITKTVSGSVSPSSIGATTPSDIPRTGLYLVDLAGQQDEYGVTQIRAVVVDFSQYA